jgi:hypothetical protein
MEFDKTIRKLAKRNDMLNQFVASKEINGIKFFSNETNFSQLQHSFLSYLYFYYNLYQDIFAKKVSEKVTENEVYENAYAYYKSKHVESKDKKSKNTKRTLEATFSKDNTVIFPSQKEVK